MISNSELTITSSIAPRWRIVLALTIFSIASALLLVRIGHYPLWDDEAVTALIGRGVWQTGDTSAIRGDNIVAYRQGLLIRNGKDRTSPPLQFYLAAPFAGLGGTSAGVVRIPFVCFGLACIALMLWWASRGSDNLIALALLGIAIIANVSLLLYFRQARYYAPAIFFSVAVVYSYWHLQSRRGLLVHVVLSILLFASNYMAFGATTAVMAVDYLIWGRHRRAIRGVEWILLLVPQILIGACILYVWNPLSISTDKPSSAHGWLIDRAILMWWTVRDLDRCEYGCTAMILLAPVIAIWKRNQFLLRAVVALAIAVFTLNIISPQSPAGGLAEGEDFADVRYFAPIIPLCITVGVMTLLALAGRRPWLTIILVPVAFGTNLLNVGGFTDPGPRLTIAKFVGELIHPLPDPYTPVLAWMNAHIAPKESILVMPEYSVYPLMFHAPQYTYAWQLNSDQRGEAQFKNLPAIHFEGEQTPDYVIAFGNKISTVPALHPKDGGSYAPKSMINTFWMTLYRPELHWHSFDPVTVEPGNGEAIYTFARKAAAPKSNK